MAHGLCPSSSWAWRQVQNPREFDNGLPAVQSAREVEANGLPFGGGHLEWSHSGLVHRLGKAAYLSKGIAGSNPAHSASGSAQAESVSCSRALPGGRLLESLRVSVLVAYRSSRRRSGMGREVSYLVSGFESPRRDPTILAPQGVASAACFRAETQQSTAVRTGLRGRTWRAD